MGDAADDLYHHDIMAQIKAEDYNMGHYFFTAPPKTPQKVAWQTTDGRVIEIKDMTTSHISSSITKCKRQKWRLEAIPYLEAELASRKD